MIIAPLQEGIVIFSQIISPANLPLRPSLTAICRAKEKGIRADRKTVFRVGEPDVKEGALLFRCKVNTLPVLASVSAPKNGGIMTDGPAQVLVVEEDGSQGGACRNLRLAPGPTVIVGKKNMTPFPNGHYPILDRHAIQEQRA